MAEHGWSRMRALAGRGALSMLMTALLVAWVGSAFVQAPPAVDALQLDARATQSAYSRVRVNREVSNRPASVVLRGVEACSSTGQVILLWSTVSEDDIVGFFLYRAKSPEGARQLLTPTLIPVQAFGSPTGADYRYLDTSVQVGATYDYYIEVLSMTGTAYTSEPLRVPVDYYAVVPLLRR